MRTSLEAYGADAMNFCDPVALAYRTSYKPGSSINVTADEQDPNRVWFRFAIQVPDVHHPDRMTRIERNEPMHRNDLAHMEQRHFLEWLRKCWLALEEHEIDEWFKYDGANVRDPHPELKRKRS